MNRSIQTGIELTKKQTKDVLKLMKLCQDLYSNNQVCFMESELNYLEDLTCFYLAYEDDELVCFLSLFTPDEISCEIYSMTRPGYENTGIFELLINTAIEAGEAVDIEDFFFVTDSKDAINSAYMEKYYKEPDSSTCLMELKINYPYVFGDVNPEEDFIFDIDIQVSEDEDGTVNHTLTFLHDDVEYGFAQCEEYPNSYCIHHLEVKEEYRGKGNGTKLLTDTLTYCISNYAELQCDEPLRFILNVDVDNEPACKLYTSFGFNTIQQIDYYYV